MKLLLPLSLASIVSVVTRLRGGLQISDEEAGLLLLRRIARGRVARGELGREGTPKRALAIGIAEVTVETMNATTFATGWVSVEKQGR